ncbi:hypothetical protein ACF061_03150 [Streptomyces sp. NPDC015220]|uniref:hypothetical protein n=1 Tax=Streptomyces sp. NPDC015220 TaxID=3364947 RepID=UPI003703083F
MHATLRRRCIRTLAAGALSAALVSVGSAGAFAADSAPMPKPSPTHTMTAMAKSISIKASHSRIRAGQSVTLTGRTANLAAGTKLTVQRLHNGKWTTLRATTVVKKGDTYTVTTKLAAKGTEHLRVVSGPTRSKTITVDVM